MFHGVGGCLILAAAVALVLHVRIRQFLTASLGGAALCSALNLAYATWAANFEVNMGWAPFMLVAGFALAAPVTLGVGLPFLMVRRSRRLKA
jgi:hypothetical protein